MQLDESKGAGGSDFVVRGSIDHPYPTTHIQWAPDPLCNTRDLLATSGDYLRLWHVREDGEVKPECTLNNVRGVWV